jgi:hypothetical protein
MSAHIKKMKTYRKGGKQNLKKEQKTAHPDACRTSHEPLPCSGLHRRGALAAAAVLLPHRCRAPAAQAIAVDLRHQAPSPPCAPGMDDRGTLTRSSGGDGSPRSRP